LEETLASADDQTVEFKRRLRKLVENATTSNLGDDDVREVIELVTVTSELEE
jgi:regulator of replication initiation timing